MDIAKEIVMGIKILGSQATIQSRKLEQQAEFFSSATNIHGDLPLSYHYWFRNYVQPSLVSVFGAREVTEFYTNCIVNHIHRACHGKKVLIGSIGCGEGIIEINICKILLEMRINNFYFACVDIASGAIERAKSTAAQDGVSKYISFTVSDLQDFFGETIFDVVIANQVLHHIQPLEAIFERIKHSIGLQGIFLSVDMIGRNGHMLWPEALVVLDRFWQTLSRKYKYNHVFNRYEDIFSNWDHSKEGNEGIRAQDILPELLQRFTFRRFFAVGNLAPTVFGRQFGANFDPNDPDDLSIIDTVARVDQDLITLGYLKPVIMFAEMAAHADGPPLLCGDLSPEFCLRHPEDYTIFEELLHYSPGMMIEFGERQSSVAFLELGWSSPEPNGIWSNDVVSRIVIPLSHPLPSHDMSLTLKGIGHVCNEKPRQVVEVSVNGSLVGKMVFDQTGQVKSFRLLLGQVFSGACVMVIEFRHSDCRSPSELGLSQDIRKIALFLTHIAIVPTD